MLAAAALMFAACAQFDTVNEVPESEPQAIGFDTYAQMTTRAENSNASTTNALSTHHFSFEVWAYKNTATNYVFGTNTNEGVAVTYADSKWGYTGTKYWDKAASQYEFYAAAPVGQEWVLNANTDSQADDYFTLANFALTGTTLPNSASLTSSFSTVGDIDLMIASAEPVTSIPPTDNIVQLDFNHILSRLNISVKKGANIAAGDPLVLTEISVNNLVKNGSFEESAAVQAGTTQRWSAATSPADYDISGNSLNPVTTTATYVFQALVIPQRANAEDLKRDGSDVNETTSEPYLTLSYTIAGEPYSATFNLSKAFAPAPATYYDFFEGYQHTLNITIDASAILFQADAFVWDAKSVDHPID